MQEVVTEYITEIEYVEVEDTERIEELELQLSDKNNEIEQYKYLIDNLNELLGNVYYGYAENDDYYIGEFTAFSLEYNDKYYLITAGHCVEYNNIKYDRFKFKANFSDEWIYPELIGYENGYSVSNDYAIFHSDKVDNGFKYTDYKVGDELYRLGNDDVGINILKDHSSGSRTGESGSPVINTNGEVIGILIGNGITPIDTVIENIE